MSNKTDKILAWSCFGRNYLLDFSQTLVMGIINITPDSFSDGGLFFSPDKALELAERHLAEGADLLDLGAETTRPGSLPTPPHEEWRRLEPVLKALVARKDCPPISVDTNKSEVAEKALAAGASIVNDIFAGRNDPLIFDVAARHGVPVILMHMQGEPRTMQIEPHYDDVVAEVKAFLIERAEAAMRAGVLKERIILDPGLGFGKNSIHNLTLLNRFDQVIPEGFHSLMALSRKAFLGHVTNHKDPLGRDPATSAATAVAVAKGAEMIRVHNVAPNRDAAMVGLAIRRENC
ncbi:MAG: dihydropteroate synthase [Deltaproteobacteria bacterium]|jgi:dihydropteroate synthase|nr:dihydropteroate synthase [Deltaproteobacteria bacterium]